MSTDKNSSLYGKANARPFRTRLEQRTRLRRTVLLAMLFALALVLSWLEGFLPPIPAPVPLKFGLSNIAVMYSLFFLDAPSALILAIMKSTFVLMQRGFLSASLSLGGGLLSVLVMLLLSRIFRQKVSYLMLSVSGAIFHNIGQFSVLLMYYRVQSIAWIMPYLLVVGIGTGVLSAVLLKTLLPALRKLPGGMIQTRISPTDPPLQDLGKNRAKAGQGEKPLRKESSAEAAARRIRESQDQEKPVT